MTITQQQVLHAGDGRRSGPLTESCDNVLAWRAGEACSAASKAKAGDYIDRGLALIIELRKQGLHVVQASDGQYIEQSTAQPQAVVPAAQPSAQAERAPVVQAVPAGDAVLRKHVLLMLDGMGEQVNATPSTPGNMALQKGMRMAIGTAIDRVKSLPGADESRTFMGEPVVSPRPIGFVVLNHFGPNKHLFSSFYETRNSEHEWAPVFADRASSGATPADVRMLTGDEHEELENALGLAIYLSVARVIQRKFCAVNAGKRIPADGVIGGV